ncbi:hypothetical protein [Phytoactinopolyspora endophytica]|uniref:hypothetical protein n=1 Tax=Phytoactinopolyspora endophytica TaxID=1642495 RepID=UPI0013ED6B1F|nr:hypothetical protein [Phytoactinopolyspora endophytica]
MFLYIVLLLALIAAVACMVRWVRVDGGPQPASRHHHENEWSQDLPSCPYTQRILP